MAIDRRGSGCVLWIQRVASTLVVCGGIPAHADARENHVSAGAPHRLALGRSQRFVAGTITIQQHSFRRLTITHPHPGRGRRSKGPCGLFVARQNAGMTCHHLTMRTDCFFGTGFALDLGARKGSSLLFSRVLPLPVVPGIRVS